MGRALAATVLLVACLSVAAELRGVAYDGTPGDALAAGTAAFAVLLGATVTAALVARIRAKARAEDDPATGVPAEPEREGDRLDLTFLLLVTAMGAAAVALELDLLPDSDVTLLPLVALVVATAACGLALAFRMDRRDEDREAG